MPRLAICSHDLHWQWINWTLLCDNGRLASPTIAQHVFQPALTGRLQLISRKIVSCEREQRLSRLADFGKNCLPRIGSKELRDFLGAKKMGSNMRPRYIQFRYIHGRDISGVYCIGIPIVKIRSMMVLCLVMETPVLVKRHLYVETVSR